MIALFLAMIMAATPCTGEVWGYVHPYHPGETAIVCLDTPTGETLTTESDADGVFRFEAPRVDGEFTAYVPNGGADYVFTWADSRDGRTVGPLKVDVRPRARQGRATVTIDD